MYVIVARAETLRIYSVILVAICEYLVDIWIYSI